MSENEIPFGKRMFPKPVSGDSYHFKSGVTGATVIIETPEGWTCLNKEGATTFVLAHPAVKELVRVAQETVITLRGNDLNSSANKLAAFLAPFEDKE